MKIRVTFSDNYAHDFQFDKKSVCQKVFEEFATMMAIEKPFMFGGVIMHPGHIVRIEMNE